MSAADLGPGFSRDLPLLVPANARAAALNARCLGQASHVLRPLAVNFQREMLGAGHVIVFTQGRRTPAEQEALYAIGRRAGADGAWTIVQAGAVVTKARTIKDSPHGCSCGKGDRHTPDDGRGCALALDWCFLVDGKIIGPRPGKGNDSYDEDLPWRDGARIARDCGLVSGATFGESAPGAFDGWDKGHIEVPSWRRFVVKR